MKTNRPATTVATQPAAITADSGGRYLHALCALRPNVSAVRLAALLRVDPNASTAWSANPGDLRRAGWSEEAITAFERHRASWDLDAAYERLRQTGLKLIRINDDQYPRLLRELYDPPIGLYARGSLRAEEICVAIVGSRRATPYGRTVTQSLTRPLAARGLTIVSGLAYGIDAEAHRAAVAVRGRTIAVLGGGIDDATLYPRAHRALAHEIIAAGGAVVSEFPPGTPPRAEFFPQRNRIIAGMARAVVVVEAARESGALITARLGLASGREVLVVPGPITSALSEGTNRLLRDGAAPALSADDILEALALDEILDLRPAAAPPAAQEQEPGLLALLGSEPKSIDALVGASKLPAHEIASALSFLELDGRVRDVGGKNYVRV